MRELIKTWSWSDYYFIFHLLTCMSCHVMDYDIIYSSIKLCSIATVQRLPKMNNDSLSLLSPCSITHIIFENYHCQWFNGTSAHFIVLMNTSALVDRSIGDCWPYTKVFTDHFKEFHWKNNDKMNDKSDDKPDVRRMKPFLIKISAIVSSCNLQSAICMFHWCHFSIVCMRCVGDNMAAISRRKTGAGTNASSRLRCFIESLFVPSVLLNVIIFR